MNAKLNLRQQRFLHLYTGKDERYQGNATQSYGKVYGCIGVVAQTGGSRLVNSPAIAAILADTESRAIDRLQLNAEFVLNETARLYDRAMGDVGIPVDVLDSSDESGVREILRREYNPSIARQCLEQIGRHKSVQAFQDNVEHSHTHYLESRLAARSKVIEGRAVEVVEDERIIAPEVKPISTSSQSDRVLVPSRAPGK